MKTLTCVLLGVLLPAAWSAAEPNPVIEKLANEPASKLEVAILRQNLVFSQEHKPGGPSNGVFVLPKGSNLMTGLKTRGMITYNQGIKRTFEYKNQLDRYTKDDYHSMKKVCKEALQSIASDAGYGRRNFFPATLARKFGMQSENYDGMVDAGMMLLKDIVFMGTFEVSESYTVGTHKVTVHCAISPLTDVQKKEFLSSGVTMYTMETPEVEYWVMDSEKPFNEQ